MKIVSHDLYFVHLPVRRDHTWASKMEAPIGHHIILRIRTDDGVEGWGEAPPSLHGAARGCATTGRRLRPRVT